MRDQRLRPPRARSVRNLSPPPAPELSEEGTSFSPAQTASLGRILCVEEIAQLFHICPETVKRRLRERKLHGFKFGKEWYAREADLLGDILHALESGCHLRRKEER
jgi:hypothetical protein